MKQHKAEGRHRFFTKENAARARFGLAWSAVCEWCTDGEPTPERVQVYRAAAEKLEYDAARLIGRLREINRSR